MPSEALRSTEIKTSRSISKSANNVVRAKPFLKWAGGKSQLLEQFELFFPRELKNGSIKNYYEPFIGGGAVFFHVVQKYNIKSIYISDLNPELILVYKVIQRDVGHLTEILNSYAKRYLRRSVEERKKYFYSMRSTYNKFRELARNKKYSYDWVARAAQMIFLNKTCYNGLYRVNRQGEFNVPFGNYKNPQIIDEHNLRAVSKLLSYTTIEVNDFTSVKKDSNHDSFVYFDPPYRPISKTSKFTSYSTNEFDDNQQRRLAELFANLSEQGFYLMLSNSDPKNEDPKDNFFEIIYNGFKIDRVRATRMINCHASKRGRINELVITNY